MFTNIFNASVEVYYQRENPVGIDEADAAKAEKLFKEGEFKSVAENDANPTDEAEAMQQMQEQQAQEKLLSDKKKQKEVAQKEGVERGQEIAAAQSTFEQPMFPPMNEKDVNKNKSVENVATTNDTILQGPEANEGNTGTSVA